MVIREQNKAVSGNGCGHHPDDPRWFIPPPQHKARPPILTKLCDALRSYYDDPSTIPSLNSANGSSRQQNSARRESCILVMCALTHYTDLVTLRVGIPQADGSMKGITMNYIAELCDMGLRRTERAIEDLVKAGIVTVHPITEKIAEGVYKGSAAIRTVSKSLFALFGLGGRLRHERDKAVARRRKQQRKASAKGQAKFDLMMNAAALKGPAQDELADDADPALPEAAKESAELPDSAKAFFEKGKQLDAP